MLLLKKILLHCTIPFPISYFKNTVQKINAIILKEKKTGTKLRTYYPKTYLTNAHLHKEKKLFLCSIKFSTKSQNFKCGLYHGLHTFISNQRTAEFGFKKKVKMHVNRIGLSKLCVNYGVMVTIH